MATDLENMLIRVALMQEAIVTNSDAVPVSAYAQEGTPYWTNQIVGFETTETESEQLQIITYRITMTLVLAVVTEGFGQEAEKLVQAWLPVILLYFGQRRQLRRTNTDTRVVNLYPRGAYITAGQADYGIAKSGVGQPMFGIDFNLEVPMYLQTPQLVF